MTIYVDRVAAARSTNVILRPEDSGAGPNDWLGRSQTINVGCRNARRDEL